MNTPKTRLVLLGIAAGILLALLLSPQTRWMVRLPLTALSVLPGRDTVIRQQVVNTHPNDFQIQLAGRPQSSRQTPLEYDRSLVAKFPKSASLRAAILREATNSGRIRLHRDEDALLEGTPVSPFQPGPDNPAPTPAQLAAFDADAAAGERLAPNNAYFPFMRSVGLFASNRDAEGLAAVERASQKPVWKEYFNDEAEGGWRINNEIYGGREVVSDAAISAGLLFPHYAQLRSVARVMVCKAVLDEQAGHAEMGLVKRKALARCGALMQVQATTIIGNLVGGAVNAIATARPGGELVVKPDSHLSGMEKKKIRLDAYCAYVTKIGHPEAAAAARSDDQTWQQVHQVTSKVDTYVLGTPMSSLIRTGIAFFTCIALLPNISAVFLMGLLAAGLSRLPSVQERRPLPAGTATGFWLTVLLGLLLAGLVAELGAEHETRYAARHLALAFGIPLAITGLLALVVPPLRPRIVAGLTAAGITLAVAAVFGIASSWQAVGLAWLGFCFVLPMLMTLIWGIAALVKRVPFSVKAVESFRAVMPPLVCALMLVYGGLVLWTVQQEARANYGLERSLHGEGQYLAQITGQAWPKQEEGKARG